MVVVIAVIVILLALVVPAATQMWNQRAISDSQNAISGLLMTTRAKAMRGDMGEMGLFFYVDKAGTQQVATIAKSPIDPDRPAPDPTAAVGSLDAQISKWRTNPAWQDVFTIIGQPRAMPSSMRVMPRRMLDPGFVDNQNHNRLFANEDFGNVSIPSDNIDRHRNFFVFLYSSSGEPVNANPMPPPLAAATRNILVRDRDEDQDGKGDVTGMLVGGNPTNPGGPGPQENPGTTALYDATPTGAGSSRPFAAAYSMQLSDLVPPGLIGDPGQVTTAMTFRTVDGLLVYDDALLREAGNDVDARVAVLRSTAQPFYVSRLTGAVVKGPQGENNPDTP